MKMLGKRSVASALKIVLDILWGIGWLAVVIFLAVSAYLLVTGKTAEGAIQLPVQFELDPSAYSIAPPGAPQTGPADGARIERAQGDLVVPVANSPAEPLFLAMLAAVFGVVLLIVYQLRRIFATLARGTPFVADNARRIRLIGWIVVFGEVVQQGIFALTQYYIGHYFTATGLEFHADVHIRLQVIFGGFVLLVLGEVFRIGVEMVDEQSLTV